MSAPTCDTRTQKSVGPLGLFILLRNTPEWESGSEDQRRAWDLEDADVRNRLEKLISGPVFKSYGSKHEMLDGWPFFCVSELRDLEAWADVQALLEQTAADQMLEWDVVAFGRRAL